MASDDKKTYHGWAGEERREADRRAQAEAANGGERRDTADRRKRQRCFVCGHTFDAGSSHARVCKTCRQKSLRGGRAAPRSAF